MKKLLQCKIVLILAGFLFLVSSCTDDHYYEDEERGAYSQNYFIDVHYSQWRWDNERECYYYELSPSWLTENIAVNGLILALIDTGDMFYPLTHVAHYYAQTGAGGYFYTETISYEFDVHYLRFNVAASDLFDNTSPDYQPNSYSFQIRLYGGR